MQKCSIHQEQKIMKQILTAATITLCHQMTTTSAVMTSTKDIRTKINFTHKVTFGYFIAIIEFFLEIKRRNIFYLETFTKTLDFFSISTFEWNIKY